MTGAWNHAYGRATVLVERLARLRKGRQEIVQTARPIERTLALAQAAINLEAAGMATNDLARKAAALTLQEERPLYQQARAADDDARDALAQLDAEIAADHDRLMLVRAEMAWLTATASQQREEERP